MAYYITDKDGNLIKVAGNYSFTESETFLMAHPIGSYYISQNPTSPAELYGGGWEELDAGKTLWTIATTETGAGETIEAGLPNITGETSLSNSVGGFEHPQAISGAFRAGTTKNYSWNTVQATSYALKLDASKNGTDPIYGKSTTVQPPAIKVYMWKRYQQEVICQPEYKELKTHY